MVDWMVDWMVGSWADLMVVMMVAKKAGWMVEWMVGMKVD